MLPGWIISRVHHTTWACAAAIVGLSCSDALACRACAVVDHCNAAWEWVEVEEEYKVKVPYTEALERTVSVWVPRVEEVERTCTVMVPCTEVRKSTRAVVRCIPETKTQTISRDFGCWQTEVVEVPGDDCTSPCGSCDRCCLGDHCCATMQTICRRVWVPDVRTKEIAVTTYRISREEVPCEYTVTVCRPEQRTKTVKVVRLTAEQRTEKVLVTRYREESRTRKVCVPKMVCQSCCSACDICKYIENSLAGMRSCPR